MEIRCPYCPQHPLFSGGSHKPFHVPLSTPTVKNSPVSVRSVLPSDPTTLPEPPVSPSDLHSHLSHSSLPVSSRSRGDNWFTFYSTEYTRFKIFPVLRVMKSEGQLPLSFSLERWSYPRITRIRWTREGKRHETQRPQGRSRIRGTPSPPRRTTTVHYHGRN